MDPSPAPKDRQRRFGLRAEVGALVAAISVTASIGAGALAYRQMTELTHWAGLRHAAAVLEALSVPAAVAIADNDLPKLDSFVAELVTRRSAEILFLEVVNTEGRVLATSQHGMVDVVAESFEDGFLSAALATDTPYWSFGPNRDDPQWLDLAQPVLLGQRWGTLVARFSLTHLTERLEALEHTVIALSALSALVGWLVSVFLLNRLVVRPVRRLARMAQRLGDGELDIRTDYERGDEVGDLGGALNRMARRLETYTEGLELAVQERTADLETANQELERLATTDGLTGLRNHRYFQEWLEFELKRAGRHPRPVTLLMLDVDHFKNFNDTHGHPAGDELLIKLAQTVEGRLRGTDIVARYGGEELAVVLLDTDREGGARIANDLRDVIRALDFPGAGAQPLGHLSASIGSATFPADAEDRTTLIRRADTALYQAKRTGRDRVVHWSADLPDVSGRSPASEEPSG